MRHLWGCSTWAIWRLGHSCRESFCKQALCWECRCGGCFLWRRWSCLETFGHSMRGNLNLGRHFFGFYLYHCDAHWFLIWFPLQPCLWTHWFGLLGASVRRRLAPIQQRQGGLVRHGSDPSGLRASQPTLGLCGAKEVAEPKQGLLGCLACLGILIDLSWFVGEVGDVSDFCWRVLLFKRPYWWD